MKKLLVGIIMASILLLTSMALAEGPEEETVKGEVVTVAGVEVLKLPYGVSVELAPDERLPTVWWRTFSLDVDQDLDTREVRSYIGLAFGNYITDFNIGYSRSFLVFDENGIEQEDPGVVSFSFTWNW